MRLTGQIFGWTEEFRVLVILDEARVTVCADRW
jgi:hypothetical protein